VKEAAFPIAVQRIVGRVEVEHDPTRRFLMRVQKQLYEQLLDRRSTMANLVRAVLLPARSPGATPSRSSTEGFRSRPSQCDRNHSEAQNI
jgi:hypothetical protein